MGRRISIPSSDRRRKGTAMQRRGIVVERLMVEKKLRELRKIVPGSHGHQVDTEELLSNTANYIVQLEFNVLCLNVVSNILGI